jgi:hypothetical protein
MKINDYDEFNSNKLFGYGHRLAAFHSWLPKAARNFDDLS